MIVSMKDKNVNTESYSDYIKSGQYFKDARQWYAALFIAPFVQRSWLFVLATFIGLFFIMGIYNVMHILPLEDKVPYILEVDDSLTQSATIEPLSSKDEDAWVSVAMHLVKDYVSVRESYRFSEFRDKKLEQRKQRIRKSSSKNVYQEYASLLNDSNPRSPIRLYRNEAVRNVEFDKVSFTRLDETSAKVDVQFTATVNELKTNKETSSKWKAELYFQLPVIDPEAQKGVTLSFLVTSYKVTPVQ